MRRFGKIDVPGTAALMSVIAVGAGQAARKTTGPSSQWLPHSVPYWPIPKA